jgi:hypothetical protein
MHAIVAAIAALRWSRADGAALFSGPARRQG